MKRFTILIGILVLAGLTKYAMAGDVVGASIMTLRGPVRDELRGVADSTAVDSLAQSMRDWVSETLQMDFDSTNPVSAHYFDMVLEKAVNRAEKDSYVDGREWIVTITLSEQKMHDLITEHNSRLDSLVQSFGRLAVEGAQHQRYAVVYNAGIKTLFYAAGIIGAPLGTAKDSARAQLVNKTREELQKLLSSITVTYSAPVLKGKPPNPIENEVTVTAVVDSVPFAELVLDGLLPDGRKVITVETGVDGKTDFGKMKMPFVPYGTFLNMRPNAGPAVDTSTAFRFQDLGLEPGSSLEQTLIFQLIKPTYRLSYQVNAANEVEIPEDFQGENSVRKFLRDSCHMESVDAGKTADLVFDIRLQVSSYSYDKNEETRMKTETQTRIEQTGNSENVVEDVGVLYEKAYDSNHEIPTGLYFWETTIELRNLIREMLDLL
jgi:hypothetical protein